MSPHDDDPLIELGAAAADGAEPDPPSGTSSGAGGLLNELRTIALIARSHSLSTPGSGSVAAADPPEGSRWGSLVVGSRIARGRFGDVYRAFDPTLQREVALKLLRGRSVNQDGVVDEGRLAARVRHPNVVTIYGAQTIDGRSGLWMELIEGHTLADELARRGYLPADEITAIGRQLCLALAAVHDAGLVHRDVKASNIMREKTGRIVLGDFGTGQELTAAALDAGDLAGTPAYLAPEIFDGAGATAASDLYSLGALLFQLATGRYPVSGRSLAELRAAHAAGRRIEQDDLRRRVPAQIANAILRAIERDPRRRFGSAREMAEAFERAASNTLGRWIAAAGLAVALGAVSWLLVTPPPTPAIPASAGRDLPLTNPVPATPTGISGTTKTVDPTPVLPAARPPADPVVVSVVELLPEAFQFRGSSGATIRRPSRDGKYAACTINQQLAVCDVPGGTAKLIGRKRPPDATGVRQAAISPDGTLISYTWSENNTTTLRVSSTDGTGDRALLLDASHPNIALGDWSSDGRGVVARTFQDQASTYWFVPLTGSPRVIATSRITGQLSPDWKWIAYAKTTPDGGSDVYVHEIATGRTVDIAPHSVADDSHPFWTNDGKRLVFSSNRIGERGLFVVDFSSGVGSQPRLVTALGRAAVTPLGFTDDGELFLQAVRKWTDAVVADVDLPAGTVSVPRPAQEGLMETSLGPSWSSDGTRLAYLAEPIGETSGLQRARVVVREFASGRVADVPLGGLATAARTFWLHDGRLGISYSDGTGRVFDAIRWPVLRDRILDGPLQGVFVDQFRPVLYFRERVPDQLNGDWYLYRYDLASNSRTLISDTTRTGPVTVPPRTSDLQIAEDGRIAVFASPVGRTAIRVLEQDGTFTDFGSLPGCSSLAWSRDGKFIVAGCFGRPGSWNASLWILNVETGALTEVPTTTDLIQSLSIRPDGRMIAYAAGNPQPEYLKVRVGAVR